MGGPTSLDSHRRYNKSAKGQDSNRRYNKSAKGQARNRRYNRTPRRLKAQRERGQVWRERVARHEMLILASGGQR